MPFLKLDCGILNSTVWSECVLRDIFLTALLMADPYVTDEPLPQLHVRSLDETGWCVPPGWYGFIAAAGIGIIRRALVDNIEAGLIALERLGSPEQESRSQDFDGRRVVRVNGGYIALNYDKYRERDLSGAERQRRYRARKGAGSSRVTSVTSRVKVTQVEEEVEAEAEAEKNVRTPLPKTAKRVSAPGFDAFWAAYPNKKAKIAALKAWRVGKPDEAMVARILNAIEQQKQSDGWQREGGRFIPHPATWLNQGRWADEPLPAEFSSGPTNKQIAGLIKGGEAFLKTQREKAGV